MKATLAEIINVVEIIIVLLVVSTVIRMGINYFTTGQILWGVLPKIIYERNDFGGHIFWLNRIDSNMSFYIERTDKIVSPFIY